jgi:hypothetical protein
VLAACAAIASSYSVANAGHYGGQLVYKNGVGINTAAGSTAGDANGTPPVEAKTDND